MASKSKRRRRVLGASCILAALIIAGSSFAWFTSKDEVNNRLSANADYGVSIVESFAPPENWVPGQEVNKDVYAVNTGNVGAFVEETVSGKLTITTEVAKDDISANSVKLTAAERYAVEAGSYLAYKPATSNKELGVQVVSMIPDATNLEGYTTADAATDFTPDAAGLYVFRRSIGVDADTKVETFKYEAYYFDGHYYYKVTDLSVTPDGTSYEGDNVTTDGNLTSATAKFVEEETKTINPTALTYDSDNNRLVATYDTGSSVTYQQVKSAASAYQNALIAYQDAVAEYNAALRDDANVNTAAQAQNNELQNAINYLLAAEKALKIAQDKLAAAQQAEAAALAAKDAAQSAVGTAEANRTAAATAYNEALNAYNAAYRASELYRVNSLNNTQADLQKATRAVSVFVESTPDEVAAFKNYIKDKKHFTTDEEVDNYLATASYTDLASMNITNTQVKYRYYTLLANQKRLENALAHHKEKYNDYLAKEAAAAQRRDDARAALTAAEQAKAAAQAAKEAADQRATEAAAALTAAAGAVTTAQTAKDAADAAVTAAQTSYGSMVTQVGTASTNVATAEANYANATQTLAQAKEAYEKAMKAYTGESVLKININLADVVTTAGTADKWQLLPNPVNGGIAYFYYTSILGAGETSAQLIDSVELDSSVTDDMFKRFDFDLNVALKSAQIAMANDGKTILTDAAAELDANATLQTPTSVDSVVNWKLK